MSFYKWLASRLPEKVSPFGQGLNSALKHEIHLPHQQMPLPRKRAENPLFSKKRLSVFHGTLCALLHVTNPNRWKWPVNNKTIRHFLAGKCHDIGWCRVSTVKIYLVLQMRRELVTINLPTNSNHTSTSHMKTHRNVKIYGCHNGPPFETSFSTKNSNPPTKIYRVVLLHAYNVTQQTESKSDR